MRPNVLVSAAPSDSIAIICRMLISTVGFSNGCAEFTLKNPPPLVPRILIASCDATGPSEMTCFTPSSVVASTVPAKVCGMPCQTHTSAPITEIGSSRYSVMRVRSAQKLPIVFVVRRAKPRITATATAMPAAADRKFCTVRPNICDR